MASTFGTSAGTSLVRNLGDGVGCGCPYARTIEPVGTEITTVLNGD